MTHAQHPWVDRLFQAVDGRDWDRLQDLCDSKVTYERPGYAPLVGIAQVMHFYRNIRIIAEGRHQVDEVMQDGDALSYHGRFQGRSKDGAALDVNFCDVCKLRDGRLLHRRTFFYVPAV